MADELIKLANLEDRSSSDKTDRLFNAGLKLQVYHIPSETSVSFKAFLTQLSDSFEQHWNSEKVLGRNDGIHNFENTERSINLGWDLVAQSGYEAKTNFVRIQRLAKMSYPSYEQYVGEQFTSQMGATAISDSPIFRLKLLNFIQDSSAGFQSSPFSEAKDTGLPGRFDSFVFEHKIDEGYLLDGRKYYPKVVSVQCQFFVMHPHELGWKGSLFRQDNFPYGEPNLVLDGAPEEIFPNDQPTDAFVNDPAFIEEDTPEEITKNKANQVLAGPHNTYRIE